LFEHAGVRGILDVDNAISRFDRLGRAGDKAGSSWRSRMPSIMRCRNGLTARGDASMVLLRSKTRPIASPSTSAATSLCRPATPASPTAGRHRALPRERFRPLAGWRRFSYQPERRACRAGVDHSAPRRSGRV